MNDNIIYHGNVKLKIRTKQGKVLDIENHNTGTTKLFELISRALCGRTIEQGKPAYMAIATGEVGSFVIAQDRPSGIASADYDSLTQNTVFLCTISAYQLRDINYDGASLLLLDNNTSEDNINNRVLAYIGLAMGANISTGTTLSVEWSMHFDNA